MLLHWTLVFRIKEVVQTYATESDWQLDVRELML